MSFWQFGCAVAGYVEAHGGSESTPVAAPSDEEFEDALRRLN